MKIGEFAQRYNVSKDTLRYYVNIGLLSPRQQGSQMNFTEREEQDFLYIQKLKEMRFNIKEIRSFLYTGRFSNMIETSTLDHCLELLRGKKEELVREKRAIDGSISLIEAEEKRLEARKDAPSKGTSGVPLSAIPILACPHCGQQLEIENATITNKYICSGKLHCACGYRAKIEGGIVITGNVYEGGHDSPDLTRKLYHDTGEEWAAVSAKCNDFMLEEIKKRDLSGKTVLEANVNGFFFIYNFLPHLPKDCLYIVVDKYAEVLAMYKKYIEILYQDLDILYIADASEHFPLKKGSVDLFLSFFGENEYSFYHKNCQLKDIAPLLAGAAGVIGTYESCSAQALTRRKLQEKYPEGSERGFQMDYLQKDYEEQGYEMEKTEKGTVRKTIKHHMYTCHVDGEALTLYGFTAGRPEKGR